MEQSLVGELLCGVLSGDPGEAHTFFFLVNWLLVLWDGRTMGSFQALSISASPSLTQPLAQPLTTAPLRCALLLGKLENFNTALETACQGKSSQLQLLPDG